MVSSARRWWILVVIGIAQLMVILDNTIVNVALPSAQLDLGFSDAQRQWIVTAYALSFGSLLLIGGRMSDVFGRRGAFVTGLVGFAAASVVGGLSPTVGVLIASRALQGVFGALLAPAALSLLTTTFPSGRDRGLAFGVFSAVAGSGAATGVLLGGALTEFVDWRWCMYVNAVFAAVAFTGAIVLLPSHRPEERPRLDLVGTTLAASGLFCVVFGLGTAETDGWSAPAVLVFLIAGFVLLVTFVLTQRRIEEPLLPLRVLLDRYRGGSYLTIISLTLGMFALGLFLTYVLQQNLHFSPMLSGVAFLPMVVSIVSVSTTAPSTVLPLAGPKALIVIGLLLGSGAMFWLSRIDEGVTYVGGILGPMIIMGVGLGLAMSTAINTATLGVRTEDAGVASATVNTMQQVGGSVGTALLSSVAGTATASFLAGGSSPQSASLHGYGVAFGVTSALFLVAAVVTGFVVPFGRPHRVRAESTSDSTSESEVEVSGVEMSGAEVSGARGAGTWPAAGRHAVAPSGTAPSGTGTERTGTERTRTEGTGTGDGARTGGAGIPALVGQVTGTGGAGTVLTLIDAANGRQVDRAATDHDGHYRLVAPASGTYTVVCGAAGFQPVVERLWLTAEVVRELVVPMRRAPAA